MYSKKTTVVNATGLHARPASDFVHKAAQYKSDITIQREGDDSSANAKSIIFLLTLGLEQGAQIIISAEGEDEREAVEGLTALVESGFGE